MLPRKNINMNRANTNLRLFPMYSKQKGLLCLNIIVIHLGNSILGSFPLRLSRARESEVSALAISSNMSCFQSVTTLQGGVSMSRRLFFLIGGWTGKMVIQWSWKETFFGELMESNCDLVEYHGVSSAKLVNITRILGLLVIQGYNIGFNHQRWGLIVGWW